MPDQCYKLKSYSILVQSYFSFEHKRYREMGKLKLSILIFLSSFWPLPDLANSFDNQTSQIEQADPQSPRDGQPDDSRDKLRVKFRDRR